MMASGVVRRTGRAARHLSAPWGVVEVKVMRKAGCPPILPGRQTLPVLRGKRVLARRFAALVATAAEQAAIPVLTIDRWMGWPDCRYMGLRRSRVGVTMMDLRRLQRHMNYPGGLRLMLDALYCRAENGFEHTVHPTRTLPVVLGEGGRLTLQELG